MPSAAMDTRIRGYDKYETDMTKQKKKPGLAGLVGLGHQSMPDQCKKSSSMPVEHLYWQCTVGSGIQ